jgi:threonine dehydrogenase-like Zn-dependent dehydrogenase
VVIPSTIGCGNCSYCREGYYAQCDHANPNGPRAGTAFFGGPKDTGPFDGLQAENQDSIRSCGARQIAGRGR